MQLNIKTNNSTPKWTEDLNRHFSKEDIQMTNKHYEKMLNIIIINMQIKTIVRHHFTLVRMAIIKQSTNNKFWRGY